MEACVGQQLGLRDPDQPRIQTGESVSDPPYVRGKVARPMVQKTAGSGVYYRVNILNERKDTMEIYYPPYEDEPDFREWIWRTSDRIHKATSGKWSYVGRGGWKFNTSSKGRKKRRAAKGGSADALCDQVAERHTSGATSCDAHHPFDAGRVDTSMSESSQATNTYGSKTGSSLVAMWFDSHIQARRSVAAQGGDKVVVLGPVLSLPLRSQLGSSIDLQTNPSVSGGEATSACHADATPRNLVRPAPCMQQPADRSCTQKAATDRCDSYATLKVKVDDTGISDVAIGSSKGQCAGLDFSPGCDDSRRSSSTMEAPALDSSRAESRACHEV